MTGVAPSSRLVPEGAVARPLWSIGSLPWRQFGAGVVKAVAGVGLAWLMIWLMAGHSSSDNIVALLRFWVFGITLPGTVLWRLASPFRHNLIEDFAAGSLVGVSLLILVYLGVSPLGGQQWAWLWAAP